MSSRLAFAPDRVNASFAISRMRSRFNCASVRGLRGAAFRFLVGIKKKLQPEIVSGLAGTRRPVNSGSRILRLREVRNMNPIARYKPSQHSSARCADLMTMAERELSAFFNAGTQLFG